MVVHLTEQCWTIRHCLEYGMDDKVLLLRMGIVEISSQKFEVSMEWGKML